MLPLVHMTRKGNATLFNLTAQVPLPTDQNVRRRYDIEINEHSHEITLIGVTEEVVKNQAEKVATVVVLYTTQAFRINIS